MNREELPQEASREDKMRDALKHYEELATKACWHLSAIPDAIRAYYAYLPPAEGAAAIVKKYEDEYDFKFHWAQRDRVIRMMREFAAQQQPTAEGAEEVTAEEFIREKIRQKMEIKGEMKGLWTYGCNGEDALRWAHDFATLHAQRIADKMVSERLRERLIDYDKWTMKIEVQEVTHLYTTEQLVDEYLKWIVSHD